MGHGIQIGSYQASSAWLIGMLRSTLRHLEQDMRLQSDDPALHHVRSSILRAIADLEFKQQAA